MPGAAAHSMSMNHSMSGYSMPGHSMAMNRSNSMNHALPAQSDPMSGCCCESAESEQMSEIEQLFQLLDSNGDEAIDLDELNNFMLDALGSVSDGEAEEPVTDTSIQAILDDGGEFEFTFGDANYTLTKGEDGKYKCHDENGTIVDEHVRIGDDFTVDGFVEVGGLSGLCGCNRLYIGNDPETNELAFIEGSAELDMNDALIDGREHLETLLQTGTRHPVLLGDAGMNSTMSHCDMNDGDMGNGGDMATMPPVGQYPGPAPLQFGSFPGPAPLQFGSFPGPVPLQFGSFPGPVQQQVGFYPSPQRQAQGVFGGVADTAASMYGQAQQPGPVTMPIAPPAIMCG